MIIKALAVSSHIINYKDSFICNGCFANAINFINGNNQIITLHREGKGLSPMGWVLAAQDFDCVADFIRPQASIMSLGDVLVLSSELKLVANNITHLSLPQLSITQLLKITHLLPIISKKTSTGLYGALYDFKNIIKLDELQDLISRFSQWLAGQSIDWQYDIGKGPGLTPSSDDVLVGMLFVAYAYHAEKILSLPPFFGITPDLSNLTTSVSQNYLQYASRGIFSSYLNNLANKLANNDSILTETFELLTVGHHSGADTLLGIELGLCAINQNMRKVS